MQGMKFFFVIFFSFSQFLLVYPAHFKHFGMGDGLSQSSVMSIHQDILGRMWFGTREGITIYDGNKTIIYKPWTDEMHKGAMDVLYGNECDFIRSNREGDVFFKTDGALMRYEIRKQTFRLIRKSGIKTLASYKGDIWCMAGDSIFTYDSIGDSLRFQAKTNIHTVFCMLVTDEKIWLGATTGLFLMEKGAEPQTVIPGKDIYSIFISSSNDLWVGTRMEGLYRITPDGNTTLFKEENPTATRIANNQIREIIEDNHGNIWFGTFKGLQKFNPHTGEFTLYTRNNLPGGLSHSSVFSLFFDRQGTIWAGTYYGGVNYFNPDRNIFSYYIDNPNRNDCLNYPFVGNMVEDKDGLIWICTEGGGLNCLDRKTQTFRYFVSDDQNGPPHNNLKSICYDEKRDMLYIGTHTGGLSKFHIPTQRFHNYLKQPQDPSIPSPNYIIYQTEIYQDYLYVAARNGLFKMNLKTEEFTSLERYCVNFHIDPKGFLWYYVSGNLVKLDLNNMSEEKVIPLQEQGIRFGITKIIGHEGDIYFGTRGSGLFKYDDANDSFTAYTVLSGHLISNYCYNIARTNSGDLLVTGDEGATIFNPRQESSRFVKLGVTLPISSITDGCGVLACRDNEVFIGGTDGLASFWEAGLDLDKKEYSLYFSGIDVHTIQLTPKDNPKILQQVLPFTNKIRLAHNQNNIVVHFASTNYVDIQRNNDYEYMLEGFDERWNPTSLYNIYYTNINPGSYRLVVREKKTPYGTSQAQEIYLYIHISRAWYNTFWAWAAYILVTLLVLAFFIHIRNSRRTLAISLEKEKLEKERNEELTQAKLRFFTNISHEFRTPLTLITSQIDLLFQSNSLSPSVYNRILKISKNANRMRALINELLEFRKLEQNYVSLRVSEQDICPFLKDIYLSFHELAIQKQIKYQISLPSEALSLWFDPIQLQKVFYNLLSNAFKYTRDGGSIDLALKEEEGSVVVQVIDNGTGLSPEDARKIFDLFYQAENSMSQTESNPGAGIGLTLSQQIVQMHHGEITVQSECGYGSIFSVKLLKGKSHFEKEDKTVLLEHPEGTLVKEDVLPALPTEEEYGEMVRTFSETAKIKEYTVLLVEDNEELLQILHTLFSPLYRVLQAHNGAEGLQVAMNEKPDLIVSDVMMPQMSGTEMCMRIKNNIDLCHIPIVLLTALDSVEQTIEGLQQGADDYISKPFNSKILLIRCNNIIRNRLLLQGKLKEKPDLQLSLLAVNPLDQHLLARIHQVIDEHLADPEFDVNTLATDAGLSRSSLFAKFKALTGITPNEFIQNQRLHRATHFLRERPEMQIVEIAEQSGFGSSVYFSRSFKAYYGISPAQFRKENARDASR